MNLCSAWTSDQVASGKMATGKSKLLHGFLWYMSVRVKRFECIISWSYGFSDGRTEA